MKVAIVHYHLGPGGVSEVIATTSRMMGAAGIEHVILASSAVSDLPVAVVKNIGYAQGGEAEVLLEDLRSAASTKLGGPPDIWHFHNHSLGKNPAVPQVVALLAAAGERLLLQIHDLAEDGRSENAARLMNRTRLYPSGARVHYAFLNPRDRVRFITAGLRESHAHLLSNPIKAMAASPAPSGAPLLLYPVRGIRRKNLGEFLLLAALSPSGTRAAVTRAPFDPAAVRIHDSWWRLADEMDLPIEFDVVDRIEPEANTECDFDSWMSKATHLVTTSVAEGYGMIFHEAPASGRPLLGRNLPHLTQHLRNAWLYDKLLVPREWVDLDLLQQLQRESMDGLWRAWNRQPPEISSADEPIDFGNLPEVLQQRVIRKLAEPGTLPLLQVEVGGKCVSAVEWLSEALACREPATSRFSIPSPEAHLNELNGIYGRLMNEAQESSNVLDPDRILHAYLTPESFHFLTSPAPSRRPAPVFTSFRAIIFDVYGTLLAAPAGGVKPDPESDALLRKILLRHGHAPPLSPSTALHDAVRRHHASVATRHPEMDLRVLWREVLSLQNEANTTELVLEIEAAWHPARMMPGADAMLHRLAAEGITLGILSNAQCNTLPSLGACAALFQPDLTILSYEHGMAKPARDLFHLLIARLAIHGISPAEALYIGNDPLHDIEPAAEAGFRTALFTGDPDSRRPGFCLPDFEIRGWSV